MSESGMQKASYSFFFKTIKPLEVDSQGRITKKGEFQKMVLLATMAKEG